MLALLVAQFLSAFGDNMLFVAAITLVKRAPHGAALVPLLQAFFVVSYILLAPFVGPLADTFSKSRVLFWSNALKLAGAALMFAGINPLLTYGLVGIGAATYSPAKYGILAQFFVAEKLVKANGILEGASIAAILLGVPVGGVLAQYSLTHAFAAVIGIYALAALANLFIPALAPEHPLSRFQPLTLLADFRVALKTLFSNRDARFSLLGTSIFWGSGATLRLILFAWVPLALGIHGSEAPADLMGMVSVGVVLGAGLAAWGVRLETVNRALWGGLLLGPALLAVAFTHHVYVAAALMVVIGLCGGFFAVPLNALLQDRGHASVGAGHALAVQNFFENSAILIFVGIYYLSVEARMPPTSAVMLFGVIVLVGMGALAVLRRQSGPRAA